MTETQPSRIAFLRERVETADRAAGRTTADVPFRQRQVSLAKIEVPISFPLYNIKSGRTHRAQTEWIERNSKPAVSTGGSNFAEHLGEHFGWCSVA